LGSCGRDKNNIFITRQAIDDKVPFFVCCGGKQGNQDKPCLSVDPPDPDNIGININIPPPSRVNPVF